MNRGATEAARSAPAILVVDDHETGRRMIAETLSAAGHRVLEAEDGVQALQAFQLEPENLALLITDLVMPELSGAELVQRVHEIRPELPVLYMSGHFDDVDGFCIRAEPNVRTLTKPFRMDEILKMVREMLAE